MTVDRLWFVLGKRLSGDASREELQELEQLLSQHPELFYSVQNVMDLWRLGRQVDDSEARTALQKHLLRLDITDEKASNSFTPTAENGGMFLSTAIGSEPSYNLKKWLAVAAGLALVITCLYLFTGISKPSTLHASDIIPENNTAVKAYGNKNEISTKAGSNSKIVLPDGSTIWLNAGSKLEYDKNFDKGSNREVYLDGEAYFDVAKNPSRPFIIHTQKIDIRVLGTVFNVKSYSADQSTETSLIHGSIEVTMPGRPNEKIIMKPAEKLVVMNNAAQLLTVSKPNKVAPVVLSSINYLPSDSTVIETSWMDNRLIFRDKSFMELAHELQRKYDIAFKFEDANAGNLMFDGNFKNETIHQALQALQLANYFSYSIKNDTITINK